MQRSIAKEKGTTLDLDSRSTSVEASLDPLFHGLKIDTKAQTETETCIETKAKSAMEHPQTLQRQGCKFESLPPRDQATHPVRFGSNTIKVPGAGLSILLSTICL
jgi:hypothetical protein